MTAKAARITSSTALLGAILLLGLTVFQNGYSSASSGPTVSLDAIPDASNTATAIGTINPCRSVASGAIFTSDLVIESAGSLSGIETHLIYDPAVLGVTGVDYDFLLGTTASSLLDLGDSVPDSDGDFKFGAVTFPLSAVTGSGVLARVTLEAIGPGNSPLELSSVKLADGLGDPIQPADAQGIYLGPVNDASVTVDGGCSDSDLDGYTDADELVIGTNPAESCGSYDLAHPNPSADTKPSQNWPSDFSKAGEPLDSYLKINVLDITSFLAPVRYLGTDVGTNPGDKRWDLIPGPGIFLTDINVNDLTTLVAGSSGFPPMFGGARALNGPQCTP